MTVSELREIFNEIIERIQKTCPHEETEILEYHPIPGHMMGYVKCCKRCGAIIEEKANGYNDFGNPIKYDIH